jgi:tripartite-type tricarboxylate transporter receptor subunit TctC
MSRLTVLMVITTVALTLAVSACGQAAPAPSPTAVPTTSKAVEPAKAAEPTKAPAAQPTTAPAAKAAFPDKGKTISIIVPYAAGGTTDAGARLLAAGLEKEFGSPVQVVNKAGASAQLGVTDLFQAKPDGYTLIDGVLPTIINHYVDTTRNSPYKSRQDFQLVAHHFLTPQMLAVRADSPYKNLKDLVDAAKAKPESIKVSDSGLLANPHLTTLMLERASGAKFASVHFDGGAPSVTALLGGHVDVLAGGISDAVATLKAGNYRMLGVADTQPSEFYPTVPTFQSQGFDVVSVSSTGVIAPKGTPKEIVSILTTAIKKVLSTDDQKKRLSDLGISVKYMDPDQYGAFWDDTESRTGPIFKEQLAKNP